MSATLKLSYSVEEMIQNENLLQLYILTEQDIKNVYWVKLALPWEDMFLITIEQNSFMYSESYISISDVSLQYDIRHRFCVLIISKQSYKLVESRKNHMQLETGALNFIYFGSIFRW